MINPDDLVKLKPMDEEDKAKLSVKHYTLHLPATLTKEQLQFIVNIAKWVEENRPITVIHEKVLQKCLRWSLLYRNIVLEFDEEKRWTDHDEADFNKITTEFQPMLDWILEQYKIKVREREY